MTLIARNIAFLPNLAQACDRITARAKAENAAEERARCIRKAKRFIDDPRGCTDAQLREICASFMAMSPTREELADGWNVYYLRADQRLTAIEIRRKQAINKAHCQAALARIDDREKAARIAMRYRPQLLAMGVGLAGAVLVAVALAAAGWVL